MGLFIYFPFLSEGTVRIHYPRVQPVLTAVTLKCFFKAVFHRNTSIHQASVNEKRKWIIALSFRNLCTVGVMALFVSDLFEWLHYISHRVLWRRVKVQHRRASVSSPSKVGSLYQAFHHRCILTNGNTSSTLLYLISPWWQTVNH